MHDSSEKIIILCLFNFFILTGNLFYSRIPTLNTFFKRYSYYMEEHINLFFPCTVNMCLHILLQYVVTLLYKTYHYKYIFRRLCEYHMCSTLSIIRPWIFFGLFVHDRNLLMTNADEKLRDLPSCAPTPSSVQTKITDG
jgi:hypothetical protein